MPYYSFKVDSPMNVNAVIVLVDDDYTNKEIRYDAMEAIIAFSGLCSKVIGKHSPCYGPDPMVDFPIRQCTKNGKPYAWICTK